MCDLNLKLEELEFLQDDPRCTNPACDHLGVVHREIRPGTVDMARCMPCLMTACPCLNFVHPDDPV